MRVLATLLVLLLPACSLERGSPPPGYDGPLPGIEARRTLGAVEGRTLDVPGGAIAGGEWTVGGFAVLPNAITGKSGGVVLRRGAEQAFLPLLTDEDVADLRRRAAASGAAATAGAVSRPYTEALGL
jgi:hypothetical protein